jgi:hypothetical protein
MRTEGGVSYLSNPDDHAAEGEIIMPAVLATSTTATRVCNLRARIPGSLAACRVLTNGMPLLTFAEPVSSAPSNFNRVIDYAKHGVA